MNNYYQNSNNSSQRHHKHKASSANVNAFNPGLGVTLPHHQLPIGTLGQMHDVALEHLKVGEEVVWLPEGRSVAIHKLDIGRIHRTLYHVDHTNQEALLAVVDFHDWVESSQEVWDHVGHRSFRLQVYAKHVRKLGEFLESINSYGIGFEGIRSHDEGGGGGMNTKVDCEFGASPFHQNQTISRSYVVRPCMLQSKKASSHPMISEGDPILVFFNNTVAKGAVKRLFIGDGNLFIGAEFEGKSVYPRQLSHGPSCDFLSNGCESRIGILPCSLTKHIWDSEFRLIVKGTKQLTFEDLFYKEEPPPPYSAAVSNRASQYLDTSQSAQVALSPSAPPLTPSPPTFRKMDNWANFDLIPSKPYETSSIPMDNPHRTITTQQQEIMPLSLSRNYSTSMMNLDSYGLESHAEHKPITRQKSTMIKKSNRQSLLIDELQLKLKIQPQVAEINNGQPIRDAQPPLQKSQELIKPRPETFRDESTNSQMRPEPTTFLEELKRRQNSKNRPSSMDPVSITKETSQQNRLSLQPKPSSLSLIETNHKNSKVPTESGLRPIQRSYGEMFDGMTRATSCINISENKPPLMAKPKPNIAPKPVKIIKPTKVDTNFPVELKLPPIPQRLSPVTQISTPSSRSHPQDPSDEKIVKVAFSPPPPIPERANPLNNETEKLETAIPAKEPQDTKKVRELSPKKSKLYPDLNSENFPFAPTSTVTFKPLPHHLVHSHSLNPPSGSPPTNVEPQQAVEPHYSDIKAHRISRDNLPPPPPPPPAPSVISENVSQDDDENFPPPPTEWLDTTNDYDMNQNLHSFESSSGSNAKISAQKNESIVSVAKPNERGCLLQQIRQGIKLRTVDEDHQRVSQQHCPRSSNQQQSNNETPMQQSSGLQNIIKGAIATRRVMLDSDAEDSNNSDCDEDSDAWD